MKVTDLDAINTLVNEGIIEAEIAEYISIFADGSVLDSQDFEGDRQKPVVILIDKSSSIHSDYHLELSLKEAIINGQNHLINALLGSSSSIEIFLGQILFDNSVTYFQEMCSLRSSQNEKILNPNVRLLDYENYNPNGGTALYDAIGRAISILIPTWVLGFETG